MEQKTYNLDVKMKPINNDNQKLEIMRKCKVTETYLWLRSMPEILDENTRQRIVDLFGEFL